MIVVDSNVVAYLHIPGEYTAAAEALLEHDPEWAAPPLWRSEMRNLLAGYIRRKALTFDRACRVQLEAEDLMGGAEFEAASEAVLQLVDESDCSAYDCEFVALAIELSTKLVTMDRKLLRAFPQYTVSLV